MKTNKNPSSKLLALAKGVASGWLVSFATALLTLLLTPFALSYLSREEYAIFALANAVVSWLTVFDVGITGALTAKIAKFGEGASDERDRLVSTAVVAQNWIGVVIFGGGFLFSLFFPNLFSVPEESKIGAQVTVGLLAVASGVTASSKSYTSILMANRRVHIRNAMQLFTVVLRTVLVSLLLYWEVGLLSLAIGTLISSILVTLASIIITKSILPEIKIARRLSSWSSFGEIRSIGLWFCLNSFAILILHTVDRMTAATVVSLASVTTLTLTGQVFVLAQKNIGGLTNAAWPLLAEGFGKRELNETYRIWLPLLSVSIAISFLSACTIWSANGLFIMWWVGKANYAGIVVDTLFAINFFLVSAIYPYRAALTAAQIVRPQAVWRIAEAFLFVLTCIPFGYLWGLVGIMASTVFATLLCSATWIPILTANSFHLPIRGFMLDSIKIFAKLAACTIPVAILGKWIGMQVGGLQGAVLAAFVTGSISAFMLFVCGVDRSVSARLVSLVNRRSIANAKLSGQD
jgi:O-antigen/teichoic acid export membrane protein